MENVRKKPGFFVSGVVFTKLMIIKYYWALLKKSTSFLPVGRMSSAITDILIIISYREDKWHEEKSTGNT
jgi:hypothetical protein